jgi:collagenase-like PrtC family protease
MGPATNQISSLPSVAHVFVCALLAVPLFPNGAGSTQMSITTAEGAEFAAGLGVTRIVVGRELSVRDIGAVARGTGE